jgi:glycosyltransferase involved in cell wall biosynthesis
MARVNRQFQDRPVILEVIWSLDVGGSEGLLLDRMGAADHSRFEYIVGYVDPRRASLVPAFRRLGIRTVCFDSTSKADWRWLRSFQRLLVEREVSVVHTHSPLVAAGVRLTVRSMGSGRPRLVTTEHSVKHHWMTSIADGATIRLEDVVIAVSRPVAETALCSLAREVRVIHHGVNLARMSVYRADRAALSNELGILADGPSIVSVANFRPEKGHANALKALAIILAKEPSAHLYLAGQGPMESSVREEARQLGLDRNVTIMGRVPDAARVTACADVFVLASDWEGRPVAVMEALACGVPVVATAVGGVPDMIDNERTGMLVPPNAPEGLAQAVLRLLQDPQFAAAMSGEARRAAEGMEMSVASAQIESIYRKLSERPLR